MSWEEIKEMPKLRYIKEWNIIPVEYDSPFYHLPKWGTPAFPTIVIGTPSTDYLAFFCKDGSLDKTMYSDKVPSDLFKVRHWTPTGANGAAYVGSDDLLFLGNFSKEKTAAELSKILLASVAAVLAGNGLRVQLSPYGENRNDLYIKIGDKLKKFLGFVITDMGDWYSMGAMITFDSRIDKIKDMWKIDSENITKKGDVSDLSDIIGGLDEAKTGLDKIKIADDIAAELAKRLELTLSVEGFTDIEMEKMDELKPVLNSDKWFFDL